MALVVCEECSNSVSDKAAACPKCGAPLPSQQNNTKGQQEAKPAPRNIVAAGLSLIPGAAVFTTAAGGVFGIFFAIFVIMAFVVVGVGGCTGCLYATGMVQSSSGR